MESTKPGGATGCQTVTCSQVTVKEEYDGDATAGHAHHFKVKLGQTDQKKYNIYCDQPRTVLEAIKSIQGIKCPDENIVIHLGEADRKCIVATHFPCSCIRDGECLIIFTESDKVEETQEQREIYSRDRYSVFYIDTVGGLYTKQKKLFRNNALKLFKYLCVYGEKGMSVEEALERDGRFIDDLSNFTLSDNEDSTCITQCTQKVDSLDQKEFKICLPRNKRANDVKQQENAGAPKNKLQKFNTKPALDVVQQKRMSISQRKMSVIAALKTSGISVSAALKKGGSSINTEEVYEQLRQQFPGLKEFMESRFPNDSYQKALNLRKEKFGKIQQSFSEVHRVRMLLKLGESVCKVIVNNVSQGTGFVLFDNFILTNAHLFKDCIEGEKLKHGVEVFFLFNDEEPDPHRNYNFFNLAHPDLYGTEANLDYVILEINPEGQSSRGTTHQVPPGLLKEFGEVPKTGEACLIGHPAGAVKKIDPTCIIEKEKREQVILDNLHPYKDSPFIVHVINQIKGQHIENIMMGGYREDKVVTYNTSMYHGSSGSPVFDAHGRVFGLHTAGFLYGFQEFTESVIEYAQPVLTIFKHFVSTMKETGNEEMLKRIWEAAMGNPHLEKVFESVVEPTESRGEALWRSAGVFSAESADPEPMDAN